MDKSIISETFNSHLEHKYAQKKTSHEYRIKKLRDLKAILLLNSQNIEEALRKDFGKAPMESAMTEVLPTITSLNLTIKKLKKWMKLTKVSSSILFFGSTNKYYYQAKGNVLIIGPWNYPFQLALIPIITSFSAGNTTIFKPSEFTPHINKVIKAICEQVFTDQEFSIIEGDAQTSQELLDLPFDHIFFTGSGHVGKLVMEKASKHLASVTLELGGKSPVLIAPDYDLSTAAKNIIWGKLVNGGQTCVAPDYVLIHKNQYKELIPLLVQEIKNRYGDDISSNEDYCQIITPRHAARLKAMVDDSRDAGATINCGGEVLVGNKIAPTIIGNASNDMKVMSEEIFGPLLPVMTYKDMDHAVSLINEHDNALALYLFTNSQGSIDKILAETNSGSVGINETLLHVGNANLAFGGAGKSGLGRYHGRLGFVEFSNLRAVAHRKLAMGLDYFYPPYTDQKYRLLKKLITSFNRFL